MIDQLLRSLKVPYLLSVRMDRVLYDIYGNASERSHVGQLSSKVAMKHVRLPK